MQAVHEARRHPFAHPPESRCEGGAPPPPDGGAAVGEKSHSPETTQPRDGKAEPQRSDCHPEAVLRAPCLLGRPSRTHTATRPQNMTRRKAGDRAARQGRPGTGGASRTGPPGVCRSSPGRGEDGGRAPQAGSSTDTEARAGRAASDGLAGTVGTPEGPREPSRGGCVKDDSPSAREGDL